MFSRNIQEIFPRNQVLKIGISSRVSNGTGRPVAVLGHSGMGRDFPGLSRDKNIFMFPFVPGQKAGSKIPEQNHYLIVKKKEKLSKS